MKIRRSKQLLVAAGLSAAVAVGAAAPASAAPTLDELRPVTEVAARAALGDIAAPQGITVQTLIAARSAGFPIYEAAGITHFSIPSTGPNASFNAIEYRRVYDINVLSSPTAKFIGLGAAAPDVFYTSDSTRGRVVVNPQPYVAPNVMPGFTVFDPTPYTFTNSPLVQLPDGGPSVGIALVKQA